jgi:hypothetical protein
MEREAGGRELQAPPGAAGGAIPSAEALAGEFREALARCRDDGAQAGRLNALMPQLGALLGREAAAGMLREVLSTRGIAAGEDAAGRSCRAVAVEALLQLGHPYAFTVSPEDLAWYRAEGRRLPWGVQGLLGLSLVAAGNQVWQLTGRAWEALWGLGERAWEGPGDWEWTVAAPVQGALLAAVLLGVMRSPARSSRGRAWQAVLLVVALLGGVVAGLGEHMGPAWLCTLVALPAAVVALSSGQERDPG